MNKALLSSKNHTWETPEWLFKELDKEFGFTLDPCCEVSTAKCYNFYTVDDNGLCQDWGGHIVFCNPPYGKHLRKWIVKSYLESKKDATKVVMLIPSRTDTTYFHDIILPYAADIRFLRGRVKFLINGKEGDSAPFGSMVVVFDSESDNQTEFNLITHNH